MSDPETEAGSSVVVIDQAGGHHEYDADDWRKDEGGHLFVTKDGRNVAVFAPGQGEVMARGA